MGKKLIRISQVELNSSIEQFVAIELNLVLKTGSVLNGVIQNVKGDIISLKNLKGNKMIVNIRDIEEIIFDK